MIVSLYSIRLGFVVVALRCRLQNLWELGTERISTTITKTHTRWQHYPDGALMTVLHRRRWRVGVVGVGGGLAHTHLQ